MTRARKIGLLFCGLLIVLTLVFIWGNSMESKAQSGEKSRAVLGWVRPFLAFFVGQDRVTNHLIRKIAHFVEFFALGAECGLFAALLGLCKRRWTAIPVFGLSAAAIDEAIQIFTDRGPSVRDVGLDFCGFAAGLVFCTLALLLLRKRRRNPK